MLFLLNRMLLPVLSLPVDILLSFKLLPIWHLLEGLEEDYGQAKSTTPRWKNRVGHGPEAECAEGSLERVRCPLGGGLRVGGRGERLRIRKMGARLWEALKAAQNTLDLIL